MHPKTGGMGRINNIAIRYVAKLSGKGVSTVQRVKRLKIRYHSHKTINFTFFSKRDCAIVAYRLKALPLNAVKYGNVQSHNL